MHAIKRYDWKPSRYPRRILKLLLYSYSLPFLLYFLPAHPRWAVLYTLTDLSIEGFSQGTPPAPLTLFILQISLITRYKPDIHHHQVQPATLKFDKKANPCVLSKNCSNPFGDLVLIFNLGSICFAKNIFSYFFIFDWMKWVIFVLTSKSDFIEKYFPRFKKIKYFLKQVIFH